MEKINILWADDEMELLKPYLILLKEKGYEVEAVTNGADALDKISEKEFDVVLLDENMPGIDGLETLNRLKQIKPGLPVIMVTKSEEDHIVNDAIGSKIADYLIKPVNPGQILVAIRKITDRKRLENEKTSQGYREDFRNIGMRMSDRLDLNEWKDVYRKLVYWELELEKNQESGMGEILTEQKREANSLFSRFVEKNYSRWMQPADQPTLSHNLFKNRINPHLDKEGPLFVLVVDNLRYDQWKVMQPRIEEYFRTDEEDLYCSILPTATHYARNAFFAGLMPSDIEKKYPQYWVNEDAEEGKNSFEDALMTEQLKRLNRNLKFSYTKVTHSNSEKKMLDSLPNLLNNKLNIIVFNFVDMLSHARTDNQVVRQLFDNEAAYRAITRTWFEHSPLLECLQFLAQKKCRVIITTDHGTVQVKKPVQVVGDRDVNTNLRYKVGKNLRYPARDVFEVKQPHDILLPRPNISSTWIFAREDDFFAYPNNFNYYVQHFTNTFQHGGISLEEMLIPYVVLSPR